MKIELNNEQAEYLNKRFNKPDYYQEGNSIDLEDFPPQTQLMLEMIKADPEE